MRWMLGLFWCLQAFWVACSGGERRTSPSELAVGTWNVQFLADRLDAGEVPRTAADVEAMARLIAGNFHVLAVEEILGVGTLDLLQSHGLPASWRLAAGTSGGTQKVGILWDSRAIERLEDVHELDADDGLVPADWSGLRYPLFAHVVARGGFAFSMVVVHLKAGITFAAASQRARQVEQLAAWAVEHSGPLVILGDCNDTLEGILEGSDTLAALEESGAGRFLTADLPPDAYTSLEFHDRIDHVFVSPEIEARVLLHGLSTVDFDREPENEGLVLSDHRPVRFVFNLD